LTDAGPAGKVLAGASGDDDQPCRRATA